jgi:hypothetical protein
MGKSARLAQSRSRRVVSTQRSVRHWQAARAHSRAVLPQRAAAEATLDTSARMRDAPIDIDVAAPLDTRRKNA